MNLMTKLFLKVLELDSNICQNPNCNLTLKLKNKMLCTCIILTYGISRTKMSVGYYEALKAK